MTFKYSAVLSNADAELGNTNGWSVLYGQIQVGSNPAQNNASGFYYFRTSSPSATYYQDYTIPASAGVGSGNVSVQVRMGRSDFTSDGDQGFEFMQFVDSDGYLMAGWVGTATWDRNDTWSTVTGDMVALPANTAKVRIGWSGKRVAGTELSNYTDNWSLDFHTNTLFHYPVDPLNKDFSLLTSHWTVGTGTFNVYSHQIGYAVTSNDFLPPGYINDAYFSGVAIGHIYQVVDIPNSGNLYTHIDAGSATFYGRYIQRTYNKADNGLVGVRFLTSDDTVIASFANVASPTNTYPAHGIAVVNSFVIPASTRKIQYDHWQVRSEGTNIDAYVSLIGGNIVLAEALQAVGNSDTTIEANLAGFNFVTTSLMIDVPTSLGMSAEPKWILGLETNNVTPGYVVVDGNWGFGLYAHSTDYSSQTYYAAYWTNYGGSVRKQIMSNSGVGPGAIDDTAGNTIYRNAVRSVYPGYITWQDNGANGANARSYAAIQFVLGGSLSVHVGHHIFNPVNVGSVTANSFGFQPDLLFFTGLNRQNINANFTDYCAPTIGFVDCRTTSAIKHRVMNKYSFNTGTVKLPGIMYSNSFMGFMTVSTDYGFFNVALHVNSIATWGFTTIVDSDNFGETVTSYQYGFTAFKFDDPQINFRIDYFSLIGSQCVQSVQTNSLDPQFIILNMINVKTENYVPTPNGVADNYRDGNKMSFAIVQSGEIQAINWGSPTSYGAGWYDASWVSSGYAAFYDVLTGTQCSVGCFTTATGGFSYSQLRTVDIASWNGMRFQYCAVGIAANAPNHLVKEDGESVFLSNQEFGDDLLLVTGSAGGGGGPSSPGAGAIEYFRRSFWTDANRDFPTQINTIREWPNV